MVRYTNTEMTVMEEEVFILTDETVVLVCHARLHGLARR